MTQDQIYQNIAQRTGGDIYLGVVGPVRSGKSTFIKRFAELMLLPRIKNEARRARAHDELPQSAAGRTIMTTEPKFIPEKAVKLELSGGGSFKARLIDCVGYMVDGALGHEENEAPRLVKSPWFDHEVPFDLAAETGTRCVIREHATVGLVVTTDGSVADLPREAYLDAERRIIAELDGIGKPYIILLNCAEPDSDDAQHLAAELAETYGHAVLPLNCTTMTVETLDKLLQTLLYEFPIREIAVQMPAWVTMLESGHWLQSAVYTSMLDFAASVHRMADLAGKRPQLGCEYITAASLTGMDLASGSVSITAAVAPDIFYKILGEQTGLDIVDEASLLPCVVSLARAKRAYDKIKSALDQVEATGYGIVMPGIDELTLEEPEIVRQGGQYGVRLSASAPSLHIMRANIHTELSPTVGSEQQGEELKMQFVMLDSHDLPMSYGTLTAELADDGFQYRSMEREDYPSFQLEYPMAYDGTYSDGKFLWDTSAGTTQRPDPATGEERVWRGDSLEDIADFYRGQLAALGASGEESSGEDSWSFTGSYSGGKVEIQVAPNGDGYRISCTIDQPDWPGAE